MRRLRSLSEAECYARSYGEFEGNVTVVRLGPRPPRIAAALTGEHLRRRFEQLLDARAPDEEAEAA